MSGEGAGGTAKVSAEVLRYESLIQKYAEEYGVVGIDLYGSAQSQYNKTTPVPEDQIKPGDLVFLAPINPVLCTLGCMSETVNLLMRMATMVRPIHLLKNGKAYIPS